MIYSDVLQFVWHWFVLLIGGWIVIAGLLLEDVPDWRWFKWSKDDHRRHTIGRIAIYVIAFGVSVESVQTIKLDVAAANARLETVKLEQQIAETKINVTKNDPLNQKVLLIDVLVDIEFDGRPFDEFSQQLRPFNSGKMVFPDNVPARLSAQLMLCETNMQRVVSGGACVLVADEIEAISFLDPSTNNISQNLHGYAIHFHIDPKAISAPSFFNDKPVSEIINNVNSLKIYVKYFRHNKQVKVGLADMIINGGVSKQFTIQSQMPLGESEGGLGKGFNDDGFTIVATAP
jgi:hypothetical protein